MAIVVNDHLVAATYVRNGNVGGSSPSEMVSNVENHRCSVNWLSTKLAGFRVRLEECPNISQT